MSSFFSQTVSAGYISTLNSSKAIPTFPVNFRNFKFCNGSDFVRILSRILSKNDNLVKNVHTHPIRADNYKKLIFKLLIVSLWGLCLRFSNYKSCGFIQISTALGQTILTHLFPMLYPYIFH